MSNDEDHCDSETLALSNKAKQSKKKLKKGKKKKEGAELDRQQGALLCVEYLNQWKNERSNWKFVKAKQIRLVSNMFDKEKV